MPLFGKKKANYDGQWVKIPNADPSIREFKSENQSLDNATAVDKGRKPKNKRVFRVVTVRGRQEQAWLDSGMWQPMQETIIPEEARAPLTVVHYGPYGSDGMRHAGAPGGAYSSALEHDAVK